MNKLEEITTGIEPVYAIGRFTKMTTHINAFLDALLKEKKSILITGGAGTGKTHNTNLLAEELVERGHIVGRTATTGQAAQLINGITLHSFLGLPIIHQLDHYNYPSQRSVRSQISLRNIERIVNTEFLFIDEISMLNDMLFDAVHWILKDLTSRYARYQVMLRKRIGSPKELVWIIHELLYERLISYNVSVDRLFLDDQFEDLANSISDEVTEDAINTSSPILLGIRSHYDDIMKNSRSFADRVDYTIFSCAMISTFSDYMRRDETREKWEELHELSKTSFTGTVRLIMIGDLLQLPPIIKNSERGLLNYIIYSPHFNGDNVKRFVLTKNWRQGDEKFDNVLKNIRSGIVEPSDKKFLESIRIGKDEILPDYIELMNSNKDVNEMNKKEMSKLKGTPKIYYSQDYCIIELTTEELYDTKLNHGFSIHGPKQLAYRVRSDGDPILFNEVSEDDVAHPWKTDSEEIDENEAVYCTTYANGKLTYRINVPDNLVEVPRSVISGFMVPERIDLKVDTRVVVMKNIKAIVNGISSKLSNGTQGVVTDLNDGMIKIRIRPYNLPGISNTEDKEMIAEIVPDKFMIVDKHHIFVRQQMPLRAAYAITIHKSQGMSLDQGVVRLDRDNLWHKSPGMGYVALSRFKNVDKIKIRGSVYYPGIVANNVVKKFYEGKSITREVNHYNKIKYQQLNRPIPVMKRVKGKIQIVNESVPKKEVIHDVESAYDYSDMDPELLRAMEEAM